MLPKFPTPYYAVIFTTLRANDDPDYSLFNDELEELAKGIEGFLGTESSRDTETKFGVSVSYWKSKKAIDTWRNHTKHKSAKQKGINEWYNKYSIRIAKVEYDNFFEKP